jgi:hypothetical protein
MYMYSGNVDPNSNITLFLSELFNEETNLCGTTKKALIIQVNKQATYIKSKVKLYIFYPHIYTY